MAVVRDVGIELDSAGGYCIRQGTAKSEVVDLGDSIEWKAPNGKMYLAFLDLADAMGDEGTEVESMFEHYVYECRPIPDAEIEEVDGGDGEGEGDESGESGESTDDDDDDVDDDVDDEDDDVDVVVN